jgi:cellulose synthase/poly-beta-1,6-N-acetylglucosamine synthase-like glycosyltransferase
MKSILFLTAAILSISLGHILRGLRWRLIIEEEETNRSAQLLNALSWGYLLNLILPLKLGEIMRMYIAGKGQPTKFKATVIASVFYERLLDLIYVCAICIGILLIWLNSQGSTIPLELLKTTQYFVLGVILLISAITISLKAPALSHPDYSNLN